MLEKRYPLPADSTLPRLFIEALDRYVNEGVPTGDFLRAVLENDLMTAFKRATPGNEHHLRPLIDFCFEYLPTCSRGSKMAVRDWIEKAKERRVWEEEKAKFYLTQ